MVFGLDGCNAQPDGLASLDRNERLVLAGDLESAIVIGDYIDDVFLRRCGSPERYGQRARDHHGEHPCGHSFDSPYHRRLAPANHSVMYRKIILASSSVIVARTRM
jgi:hypothetical protein